MTETPVDAIESGDFMVPLPSWLLEPFPAFVWSTGGFLASGLSSVLLDVSGRLNPMDSTMSPAERASDNW